MGHRGKTKRFQLVLMICAIFCGVTAIVPAYTFALDVTLAWDENKESDLAGYKIYYKPGSSGGSKLENYPGKGAREGNSPITIKLDQDENPGTGVVEFTIHDLDANETYFFVVTAFNTKELESGASNEASTDKTPPGKPTEFSSSHSLAQCSNDNTVDVSWTAPEDDPLGSGLEGYSIVWDANPDTIPDKVKDIDTITSISSPPLPDGYHFFHIRASDKVGYLGLGNWGEAAHYGPFCIDTQPPQIEEKPRFVGTGIRVAYSEGSMRHAGDPANYSFSDGLMLAGPGIDESGEGRVFTLPVNPGSFQKYVIYEMRISAAVVDGAGNPIPPAQRSVIINDDDNDGMADDWETYWFGNTAAKNGAKDSDGDGLTDGNEYRLARQHWGTWGFNWWALSPVSTDSDGDGIADKYEVDSGLNPTDAGDRDLDADNDGWSNYEESLYGTFANDSTSHPHDMAAPEVIEVIPLNNAGIPPSQERIPNNTAFAVRVESGNGIDMTDPNAITFSVSDGTNTYTRKLNDLNGTGAKLSLAIPLDADGNVAYSLWVSYYRSNETAMTNFYPYDTIVEVTVDGRDSRGKALVPLVFRFQTQGQEEDRLAKTKVPTTSVRDTTGSVSKKTLSVEQGFLKGAAITYDSSLADLIGLEPYFGPLDEIPALDSAEGVGVPVNLLPPAVFPGGVTIRIPCPGVNDPGDLAIYYYDGANWILACDRTGHLQPGGFGWMVPGSRQDYDSYVEIDVYHFSAAVAGQVTSSGSGTTVTVEASGGGGGCFISTAGTME